MKILNLFPFLFENESIHEVSASEIFSYNQKIRKLFVNGHFLQFDFYPVELYLQATVKKLRELANEHISNEVEKKKVLARIEKKVSSIHQNFNLTTYERVLKIK